jgi:hypothetical protein
MLNSEEGVSNNGMSWSHKSVLWLVAVLALITAGLLVYSQTGAFTADEGFHILTAHLIRSGKKPYLDFVFPHTPLNAYLNAAWMGIFGESWRAVHVLAAFETAGAVLLSAWFVFARFPVPGWRLPCAITVALLAGTNMLVVDFGPIAQAYGICLFLTVAAFCVSVVLVERKSFLLPALAGLLAGAAAACSLLAASTSWVLLVWIFLYNRAGNRFVKSGAFILGTIISFAPVLRLFEQGPRQVWFNIFQYHFFYREVNWPGARRHNFEVLTSWINNSQGLCLVLLALAAVVFLAANKEWGQAKRGEFYLCLGLTLATGLENSLARPTFIQYFSLLVPFVAILAGLGLYSIVLRFGSLERPLLVISALAALLCSQVALSIYNQRDWVTWHDYEMVAKQVAEIAPPNGGLLADEQVYFLTHHPPPSGMELHDSHKLDLSPELNAMFHILPGAELDRQIKAGVFYTIQMCDEDTIDNLELEDMYEHRWDYPSEDGPLCSVFSGLKKGTPPGSEPEQ